MKLLNEELNNIKYLFSYKPGKVISEQDSVPAEIRRRIPQISREFDLALDNPENDPTNFSDEFEYGDAVFRNAIDRLMAEENDKFYLDNEYETIDFMKEFFGDFILDRYYSEMSEDDEDIDFDED